MPSNLPPIEKAKFFAANQAVQYVENGMKVGLGSGSTAAWFVRCLGKEIRENGLKIKGVSSSSRTTALALEVGIDVISLDEARWMDVTIDGADEFDGNLNLLKGGGGSLLQEKIIAMASEQMIVIADETKSVETLGSFPLPVEVVPFGWKATKSLVEETLIGMDVLGRDVTLRMNASAPFQTDEGNYILDLHLNRIGKARQLSLMINQVPGVVENGLFLDICDTVVIGFADGHVEVRDINQGSVEEAQMEQVKPDNLFADFAD